MFRLTKNEQRVVVLVILALLTAAFIRYWRDVHSPYAPKPDPLPVAATPSASASPYRPVQFEESDEDGTDERRPLPSP